MRNFLAELQRRHVYKVGAAYAVAGWLLVQVVTQVFPIFDISALVQRVIVLVIVAGFPVALILAWIFDLTPQGIVRTDVAPADTETPTAVRQRRSADRKLNYLLGVLLLAAVVHLLLDRGLFRSGGHVAESGRDKSVAVLPFENLSDDQSNTYFAEGIQDEVLTRLAKIGALKVVSRTSTASLVSTPDNLPEIARKLGVAHVVEGSVQKSGNKVRIQVQLIRAADDTHLWAETYDRTLDDLFTVQSEVARAIAGELQAQISGSERAQLTRVPTQNAAAYDAYLRALAVDNHYSQSVSEIREQAENYRKAVALDPTFALAWAKLTEAETNLYYWYEHTPAQLERIRAALAQAQATGAGTGEADAAEGMYRYWGLQDYDGALLAFQRARERLPNNATILLRIANVLRRQGHFEDALALQKQAAQLDPGNSDYWFNQALTLRVLRRYAEEREACDRGLQVRPHDLVLTAFKAESWQAQGNLDEAQKLLDGLQPDYSDLQSFSIQMQQHIYRRDYDGALALVDGALQASDPLPPMMRAYYLGTRGSLLKNAKHQDAAARAVFEQALALLLPARDQGNSGSAVAMGLCFVYAGLGDNAAARPQCDAGVAVDSVDALNAPGLRESRAIALMLMGETDQAVASIGELMRQPNGLILSTPATLRLDPLWDPARDTPAFQQLLQLPQ
jgi:TolB-like protein/Flp pilus assembly protein TadD